MALSAMMQQYMDIKNQYRDYLLFYRLGDFYEMFYDDAKIASEVLDLTLTGRDCGEPERAPMCGVPYHACEGYIGKLISKGYKVAICEQMEDPAKAKGLVKREVIRVVTPGTLIESGLLEEKQNNYLAMIWFEGETAGVCFADISTATVAATSFTGGDLIASLESELATYSPHEIILNCTQDRLPGLRAFCADRLSCLFEDGRPAYFEPEGALERARTQFGLAETPENEAARIAVGAALAYLKETQKSDLAFLREAKLYESSQYLEMDVATRRNLELCETMLQKERRGSLLSVLDRTSTSMGARRLRSFVEHPLTNLTQIQNRLGAVGEFVNDFMLREDMRAQFADLLDLERLITKLNLGSAGGRDLVAIAQSIRTLPEIKKLLSTRAQSDELRRIAMQIDPMTDVRECIGRAITDDPPFSVREGGIIREGYSPEVDELRSVMNGGKGWIEKAEAEEKEKTGIKNLRIGYNHVFGYYIEVTKSFLSQVPDNYVRKQTLANAERYVTDDLKRMEATILGAQDKLQNLEYDLFVNVRDEVARSSDRLRSAANALSRLDVYISLAECAAENHYVCPDVDYSDVVDIKEGRHPVVEQFAPDSYFVPNDAYLDCGANRLILITGPNMAGKSTYMRQCALIILLAQMGSFVPAKSARIGIVDRLFTRVGASDDLAAGQSTFMLEMQEVANILRFATRRSFILYDEIGRGTSTYDGMSIARAVAEHTAKKIGAKTMFATHYHELTSMEGQIEGVINYNVAAKKRGSDVTFLRKIVRGPTDDSYGIEVARLAGVPDSVTKRAREILRTLEQDGGKKPAEAAPAPAENANYTFEDASADRIKVTLGKLDINTLTPIEAMNVLFSLQKELKNG